MTEVGQRTFDSAIAPIGILPGEADDESLDLLHHSRSAWSAPFLALIPFGCDELPMPGQDRVRGDDTGEVEERPSADRFPSDRQPAPLFVGEPDASLPELIEKDAVLLPEIVDGRLWVAVDPAGDGGEEAMPGLDDLCHGRIVGWSKVPTGDSE